MQTITGPREGDLVRWQASVESGYSDMRLADGRTIPMQVAAPQIDLTFYGLTKEETLRVINTVNVMRGGPVDVGSGMSNAGAVSGPPPSRDIERAREMMQAERSSRAKRQQPPPSIPNPDEAPKEEPRQLNRFEGLDL